MSDRGVAAVAVHHVEFRVLIAHEPVVEAEIRDRPAIGRYGGRAIGADPRRQRPDGAAIQCHLVDLGVDRLAAPVVHPVAGEQEVSAVGREGQWPGLVEGAEGELPWRAAFGRDDVGMAVAGLEIAFLVAAVGEIGNHLERRGPVGPLRLLGGFAQLCGLVRREHRKGDPSPVGGPGQVRRRGEKLSELGRLAALHPPRKELRAAALGGRYVSQSAAVRRPARRGVGTGAGHERRLLAGLDVDEPDRLARAVRHDVEGPAHVGDNPAVGTDLRLGSVLEPEEIGALEDAASAPRAAPHGLRHRSGARAGGRRLCCAWRNTRSGGRSR